VEGADALHARLEAAFADLVDRLAGMPERWPLEVPPERVAALALAALPRQPDQRPVLLHSNPGVTHVFTDAAGAFTALIDFGDAYAAHPVLDLRSWPDPEDGRLLREHYVAGHGLSAEWEAVWTTAMVHADMGALTGPPSLSDAPGEPSSRGPSRPEGVLGRTPRSPASSELARHRHRPVSERTAMMGWYG
jgi:hygromycin-B 7''-O-kinase